MARPDFSIVSEQLNPELAQEVRFFQKWGHLMVDDAITPAQVEIPRGAIDDAESRDTASIERGV